MTTEYSADQVKQQIADGVVKFAFTYYPELTVDISDNCFAEKGFDPYTEKQLAHMLNAPRIVVAYAEIASDDENVYTTYFCPDVPEYFDESSFDERLIEALCIMSNGGSEPYLEDIEESCRRIPELNYEWDEEDQDYRRR